VDHTGERLVGPMSLREALEAAEPGPGGIRMAVSSPEERLVAIQVGKAVLVRRVLLISGRGGSRMLTGEWLKDTEVVPTLAWRPA
jgi:hypothetical protein